MRLDELRTGLDDLAGTPWPSTASGLDQVHRVACRRRRVQAAFAVSAVVVVLAVTGVLLLRSGDPSPRVVPADTAPSTTTPPPPDDVEAIFDQPRIGVADHHGKVRGTIPTAAYKAAMGINPDGSPPSQTRDNTPVPVLSDDGRINGYWIPTYGFVERSVVEVPGFDPDVFAAEQNAKDDAEWWAGLTPEQRSELEAKGIPAPSTTPSTEP